MKKILEIKKITKKIENEAANDRLLLDQVDLTIYPGDFITILGGNGAGKSTLFNSIAGSSSINQGDIQFDGKSIINYPEEKRAQFIGRVFQDSKMGTAPRMTVAENLLLALNRGKKRRFLPRRLQENIVHFKELCAQVGNGLENHLQTPTGYLSGGQRQSLSLLMTTLTKPAILLLDEHTASLDPKSSEQLMTLTQERINNKNLTCLMITHDMEDALFYGNRLLLMKNGKIQLDLQQTDKEKFTKRELLRLFDQ